MKYKISIITCFIILIVTFVAEAQHKSRFIQHNLKHGISVQIPSHWQVIEKQVMDQIDTNTELLTKVPQGDNNILIAANYIVSNEILATVRISVRIRTTFTQDDIKNTSQAEIDKKDILSRTQVVNALEQMNDKTTKVSAFKTTKEILSGYSCMRTDYQLIYPSKIMNTSIYVIYLGNKAVKMTLSYEEKHKALLKTSIDKIIGSLSLKDL